MSVSGRVGASHAVRTLLCLATVIGSAAMPGLALGAPASATANARYDSTLSSATTSRAANIRLIDDSLRGRSGKMLVRLVSRARATLALPLFARLFGDSAVERPGLYLLPDSLLAHPFAFSGVTSMKPSGFS